MAKKPKRLFASGSKFDPAKHPRSHGGRWANKPNAGDDAPQGGKSKDVTADDVLTFVSPGVRNQMTSRRGEAGVRFQQYKDGMTVDECIQAGAKVGVSRAQVLSDMTWAHQKGYVRFDDQSLFQAQGISGLRVPIGGSLPPAGAAAPGQTAPVAGGAPGQVDEATKLSYINQASAAHTANQNATVRQPGDVGFRKYNELMGRDTSDVLDKAAFDAVKGHIVFRGVDKKSMVAAQYDKTNFVGNGVYGNGQYYGRNAELGTPFSYANHLRDDGWVFVSKLKADARTITHAKLQRDHSAFMKSPQFNSMPLNQQRFLSDEGRFAAFRDYDAILVQTPDYVVGLNKRAFVVSRESLPGDAYEARIPTAGQPDPQLLAQRDSYVGNFKQVAASLNTAAQSGNMQSATSQLTALSTVQQQIQRLDARIAQSSASIDREAEIRKIYATEYGVQV